MLAIGLPIMLLIAQLLHKAIEVPGIALGRRVIGIMRAKRAGAEASEAKLP
jgi:peptidoglycan/LPS O-acetylase OafA/YrhL